MSAYSADISELASILSRMRARENFALLTDQISKEPLAPLVRNDDRCFLQIVKWTIDVLFTAEELKVTSANLGGMRRSEDPDNRRLLGIELVQRWALTRNGRIAPSNRWETTYRSMNEISDRPVRSGLSAALIVCGPTADYCMRRYYGSKQRH